MREIKFRAWHVDHGDMVYFDNERVANDSVQSGHLARLMCGNHPDGFLMQYTGLKDKNGKEIYEGDVLYIEFSRHSSGPYEDDEDDYFGDGYYVGRVHYRPSAGFILVDVKEYYTDEDSPRIKKKAYISQCMSTIIGNIHENPELLEKEK